MVQGIRSANHAMIVLQGKIIGRLNAKPLEQATYDPPDAVTQLRIIPFRQKGPDRKPLLVP